MDYCRILDCIHRFLPCTSYIKKLAVDRCKCKQYVRYEGGPINGVECSRWQVPKRCKPK